MVPIAAARGCGGRRGGWGGGGEPFEWGGGARWWGWGVRGGAIGGV